MKQQPQVHLVSYNVNNTEICASAARISTTKGNAAEIFEKSKENIKNEELIWKVLGSGHRTIIEHAVFTLAFQDVSAFTEQFFIESRLASFTVKSRRYVDFSGQGYYIPPALAGEERDSYCAYMDALFAAYKALLENGIPKEDARFLLPYAFHSNFYCTLNARELLRIICDMKYGRGRKIPELQDLAGQILEQAAAVFPNIRLEMDRMQRESSRMEAGVQTLRVSDYASFVPAQDAGAVQLLNGPSDPGGILKLAYQMNHPGAEKVPKPCDLLHADRPRELEQLSYTFSISNITLSGITHMVRHRMQSVIIPSIQGIAHSNFVLADTIKRDAKSFALYRQVLEQSNDRIQKMSRNEQLSAYSYYYALSGNMMDIMTTMNARELCHFMKLRACSRAQWEIRKISIEMLKKLRLSFPELFDGFGPGCFVTGQCPEGAMTCGKKDEIAERFTHLA